MLRVVIACLTLLATSQIVAAPPPGKIVNLNVPGALEKLAQTNPAHHQKIVAILKGVTTHSLGDVPHWMQVNFDAHNVDYRALMLASNPPKRDLSFVLDDTSYKTRVTLTDVTPQVIDVRGAPQR